MELAWFPVVAECELPRGAARCVTLGPRRDRIIVVHSPGGGLHATGAVCPHEGYDLDALRIEGNEVVCRRHHLRFDVRDGCCTNAPGNELPTYRVRLADGQVEVGLWVPKAP